MNIYFLSQLHLDGYNEMHWECWILRILNFWHVYCHLNELTISDTKADSIWNWSILWNDLQNSIQQF